MNETDYNARLYEKMKAEHDKYRDWLLHQEPSEILNHTYEYTMREDIVMCILRKWQRKSKRCLSAIISISIRIPRKMFKCFERDF